MFSCRRKVQQMLSIVCYWMMWRDNACVQYLTLTIIVINRSNCLSPCPLKILVLKIWRFIVWVSSSTLLSQLIVPHFVRPIPQEYRTHLRIRRNQHMDKRIYGKEPRGHCASSIDAHDAHCFHICSANCQNIVHWR